MDNYFEIFGVTAWLLKMGPDRLYRNVGNYQSTLRDLPEERIQCVHKCLVQFQKLTRNLVLALHGQNVHRQQRQLSQFLMC